MVGINLSLYRSLGHRYKLRGELLYLRGLSTQEAAANTTCSHEYLNEVPIDGLELHI
jgi:hypothetical protein